MINTIEYLTIARNLILNEKNLIKQFDNFQNKNGTQVNAWEEVPERFSIVGAMEYVEIKYRGYHWWDDDVGSSMHKNIGVKAGELAKMYMRCDGGNLSNWGNWIYDFQLSEHTTHDDVLHFFNTLIAMEEYPNPKYLEELKRCQTCGK